MHHRPLAAGDVEAIHALYSDEAASLYLDHEPTTLADFAPIFAELVRASETWLVIEGGSIVATYRLHRQAHRCSHVVTLGGLVVHRERRGGEAGGTVMGEILERVQGEGARRLELMVEADNPRAIRFYEKRGFVKEGLLRSAFRRAGDAHDTDEVLMARLF